MSKNGKNVRSKTFWEIFYQGKQFEIVRESSDDTELTNNVMELRKKGLDVRCNLCRLSECGTREAFIAKAESQGFKNVPGLYQKTLEEHLWRSM